MNEAMSGYLKFEVGVGRVKVVLEEADSGMPISRGELLRADECSSRPRPFDVRGPGGLSRCGTDGLASEHEFDRAVIGAETADEGVS
jgi:hypothetical protein